MRTGALYTCNVKGERRGVCVQHIVWLESMPHDTFQKGEVPGPVQKWYRNIYRFQVQLCVKGAIVGRRLFVKRSVGRSDVVLEYRGRT